MRENELVAIIETHRRDSLGASDGALSNERATAMDHYHGRPYGNEDEGRSAVVTRDLSETVDWAMPAILKVFTQSGNIAEFEPIGPEDEDQAQQETDYINHVIMHDNNGFLLLHDFIKDALLLKNGYVKHWWDEDEKITNEEYQELTIEEVSGLLQSLQSQGAEVEITGQEEKVMEAPGPNGPMPIPIFDIRLQIKTKQGKCKIVALPCEELRVSKRCRGSLQDSPFVEHVTRKTRTELIQMGMKKSFVDSLPARSGERDTNTEVLARDSITDESGTGITGINDRTMDEVDYCEAYLLVDWDGDGIAELRKVVTVADRIPPGAEWNEEIVAMPVTGCVSKRVPHRHVGESLDDEVADLQEIKTALFRQMLDNIYLTNNNQWLVNERVNLADFMTSLPGGIKRISGMEPVSGSVEPVITQPIIQQVLPAIDYVDGVKENRTGISPSTTGLDPDVLKQSTKGAFMENLNRASQKIEMITRLIAETGIKELVLQVHSILLRHQDKPRMVRMRGKFVQVNPREWQERTDLNVKVGLGTGNEEEKREKLMMLTQMQDRAAQFGLVGPNHVYSMFEDLAKAMGFDMPEKYVMSPESPEFQQKQQQPPPKPPEIVIKEMELQADSQKFMAEQQQQQQDDERQAQLDIQRFQAQAEIDQQKAQTQLQQEQLRSQNDVAIDREKIAAQMELERYKADLKAQTDILVARINKNAELPEEGAVDPLATFHDEQKGVNQQLISLINQLHETISRPKTVVRDGNGRIVGVK